MMGIAAALILIIVTIVVFIITIGIVKVILVREVISANDLSRFSVRRRLLLVVVAVVDGHRVGGDDSVAVVVKFSPICF